MANPNSEVTVTLGDTNEDYLCSNRILTNSHGELANSSGGLLALARDHRLGSFLNHLFLGFTTYYKRPPAASTGAVASNYLLYNRAVTTDSVFTRADFGVSWYAPRTLIFTTNEAVARRVTIRAPTWHGKQRTETFLLSSAAPYETVFTYRGARRHEHISGMQQDTATMVLDQLSITVEGAAGRTVTCGLSKRLGLPFCVQSPVDMLGGVVIVPNSGPSYDYAYGVTDDPLPGADIPDPLYYEILKPVFGAVGSAILWMRIMVNGEIEFYPESYSWWLSSADNTDTTAQPNGSTSYKIHWAGVWYESTDQPPRLPHSL